MSNPPSRTPEAELHAHDAAAQHQAEFLEQQLEAIDLNDPQSSRASKEPRRKKLSARDLLERLNRRRLEVARINFTADGTQVGKGSYGEVVVATLTLENGSSSESANQVAVKRFLLSDDIGEENFLRTLANELHVLDGLDHLNIIKIVGFVEDIKRRIAWLVFPWEANGNVREFLLSGKWELPERVSLINDVAAGLEYLHTRQPPIRHGDLKSLNILVNSDHRAVITDFGSARIHTEGRRFETTGGSRRRQAASTNSTLTLGDGCPEVTVSTANAELTLTGPSWSFRWAAPEVLNEEEPCLASDIWALGWIAWEIVTDNYPFPEAKTNKLITIKVIAGLLPSLYDDVQLSQIGELCYVMVRCWKSEPKERPSAAECRRIIQWVPSAIPRTSRSDGTSQIRSAALLVQMGEMHHLQGRHKEALELLDEGISVARSAGDKGMTARALYLAAICHQVQSNYDKAEESCNQSLAIYRSIGDSLGRANVLKELGEIHLARFNHAEAEELYNQALAIFTSIGNSLGRANTLDGLGRVHLARSNHAEAEESFSQALALYKSLGRALGQANSLVRLSEFLVCQARYSEAKPLLNEVAQLSNQIDYEWARNRSKKLLAEVLEAEKSSTGPSL